MASQPPKRRETDDGRSHSRGHNKNQIEVQTTFNSVRAKGRLKAPEIKNRGSLSPKYYYFEAQSGNVISNSSASLSDDAETKYYTVAADMLVFNASCSHVLLIFRCPHDKRDGRKCADNVLDQSSFQYKGCLATPGGFFDAVHDYDDKTPDFRKSALRELNEECNNLLDGSQAPPHDAVIYIGPEFNNFRDIRWFTSTNYVPTLATQYATILPGVTNEFPPVKGSDDACGTAYWVDLKIIEYVYKKYKNVYDSFDVEYDEAAFQNFVNTSFVLDKNGKPRNKLKSENTLLNNLDEKLFVVNFETDRDYHFTDFAFDHVKNIVKAKRHFNSPGLRSLPRAKTTAPKRTSR
ncbi:hypothetical protein HK100_003815, partial [Physocladia obscura]